MKILLTSLKIILAFQVNFCFGQDLAEGEYWDSAYSGKLPIWEYKDYTKDDVIKANQQLISLRKSSPKSEWEGKYDSNSDGLGEEKLYWSVENGFVKYYFYHTLKNLKFGNVINKADSIILQNKGSIISKGISKVSNKLIKIKFDNQHYLVPETSLKSFLETTVGVYANIGKYFPMWIKTTDYKKEQSEQLIIPPKYKYLRRFPIETKIIRLERRKIYREKFYDGTFGHPEIQYFVTLEAGQNKKIKVGMNFFAEDLGEWIEITKVNSINSIGKITRDLAENNSEQCWDNKFGQGEIIPCKKIKVGMKTKTKRSENFLFVY